MYGWLSERLEAGVVITANQRLARALTDAHNRQQRAAGRTAWPTAAIYPLAVWLQRLADNVVDPTRMPVRLSPAQSQLLWEQCLSLEINDPLLSTGSLSRLLRDAWQRTHDWQLPFDEVAEAARSADQHLFVRAAHRYRGMLEENGWIDEALLAPALEKMLAAKTVEPPASVSLVGFDRPSPQTRSLCNTLEQLGTQVVIVDQAVDNASRCSLQRFEDADAELRAAGAWARQQLLAQPQQNIAIVVNQLEQNAERCDRLIREGLTPGWQIDGTSPVDRSYGRSLADYPAVHDALLALRWLFSDLGGAETGRLLRSPFLGAGSLAGRQRLELRLRELPDRRWSMSRAMRALQGRDDGSGAEDWLGRLERVAESGATRSRQHEPRYWGEHFARTLDLLGWPGDGTLNSHDFQLIERWRALLDEFTGLQLVTSGLGGAAAVARLTAMAAETVFQPRLAQAVVAVLGPLEAAGMRFDRLWVAGFGADQWPPNARAHPLIGRELQRRYGMPDASPEDTAAYAATVIERLTSSARECVVSYPVLIDDAEQLPSALLADIDTSAAVDDPGWYANVLPGTASVVECKDPVPAATGDEQILRGASTINRQMYEPFAAFAFGRLGVRWLQPYSPGIAPNVRGNLVHDTLAEFYADLPGRGDIRAWNVGDRDARLDAALTKVFGRYLRHADERLRALLMLERQRTAELVQAVVALDADRGDFTIAAVEQTVEATIGGARYTLRCDRVDRLTDGSLVILDYKTGATKSLLRSGEPDDVQLVVYASAADTAVAGIGLFNVDKQGVLIDGAGPALTETEDWDAQLGGWLHEVTQAAKAIAAGDVRINVQQGLSDARPLALLSRFVELERDH